MVKKASLVALLLASAPSVAFAADGRTDFENCDGYPAPTRRGDGIATGTFLFGMAGRSEDIRRGESNSVSPVGLQSCDRALANPALKPEFVLRRASLLQAKAFYQADVGQHDDALATLAAIEQLGLDSSDPLFARGLGLGNRLVRTYALVHAKRNDEALAELTAIERDRPYAAHLRDTIMRIRLMIDGSVDNHIRMLRERAPTNPLAAFEGFDTALRVARFGDAVDFGSGLSFELPKIRGAWTVEGQAQFEYQRIELQADFDGALAYALAANGDLESSARRLAAAYDRLSLATAAPPPPAEGRKLRQSVEKDYALRLQYGRPAREALERWGKLIALRREAPELDAAGLFARIDGFPQGTVPVLADLVSQLGRENPADIEQFLATLLEKFNEDRINGAVLEPRAFLDALPRPETPATQVKLKRAGDGYFLSDNGFSRAEMDSPDDWTIRFTDDLASRETVEEFGMLAAAEETLRRGYDGFVVTSRRMLERTTTNTYYGTPIATFNSGREAQLRITMVRNGEVPVDLAGSEWRVVRADEIKGNLSGLPQAPSR